MKTEDGKNISRRKSRRKTDKQQQPKLNIIVKPKNETCDICQKGFIDVKLLVMHKQILHAGVNPFSCDMCEETFADRRKFTQHKLAHSGRVII